jgi:membrane-bound serine protease (ClpP class)
MTRLLIALALVAAAPLPAQQREPLVYRIPVTGTVEMGLAPFVERSLREAAAAGATAAVLELDTPGGRVDAAERISDALSDAPLPVYAWVNRRAFSAGALIALSTNRVYMRPGSVMGAATPVGGDGVKAAEKYVSAMRSEFRAIAEARGLDPRVAEAMVDEAVEVPGVVAKGQLLSLSTEEAKRVGYAAEAADWDALMGHIGAPGARVVEARANWAEQLVRFFSNPLVAPLLLSLGFLGLIVEIKTPSFGLAGVVGLACLALFFGSHLIIGLAGWESIILFAAGLVLLAVEAFVLPGFGVAGFLGILAVLASIVLSMVGRRPTGTDIAVAGGVIAGSLAVVLVVSWQLLRHLSADQQRQRGTLWATTSRAQGYVASPLRTDLVGAEGVALTDLRPAGTARFGDERVDVVSEGPFVTAGTAVRITRAEGYRHVVRPVA